MRARGSWSRRAGDRLRELAARIVAGGAEAFVVEADVARREDVERMVKEAHARWGSLDILVNNAGLMLLAPVDGASTADWERMIGVNLLGLMYATRAALPLFKQQGGGHVVNISSTAGRFANPDQAVYAATKFGVGAFSESLRREVYKDKIRVTLIEPGVVETELRIHITDAATKQRIEAWATSLRQLQSEDVAAAIVYATTQPAHVNVNEILLRPTDQER